jgi:hypothetical protein
MHSCLKGSKSITLIEIRADGGQITRPKVEKDSMQSDRLFGDGVIVAPARPVGVLSLQGFAVCPMPFRTLVGASEGWMQGIYCLAYQQAQEALLRPWHERSLLASLN